MQRIILAALMLAAAGPAFAADMAVKARPLAAPAFSWTGFYVGTQAAYTWGRDSTTEFSNTTGLPTGFFRSFATDGWFGGVHAGYNYQAGIMVVGIEGDVEFGRASGGFTAAGGLGFYSHHDWQASIRGRLGATPSDRLLLYVTGGAAFSDLKYGWTTTGGAIANRDASFARTGWTTGGGGEYAITDHVTVRLEYRYSDFGQPRFAWPEVGGSYVETPHFHAMRAGLSYRF